MASNGFRARMRNRPGFEQVAGYDVEHSHGLSKFVHRLGLTTAESFLVTGLSVTATTLLLPHSLTTRWYFVLPNVVVTMGCMCGVVCTEPRRLTDEDGDHYTENGIACPWHCSRGEYQMWCRSGAHTVRILG